MDNKIQIIQQDPFCISVTLDVMGSELFLRF